jgi:hypothetical protein
MIGVPISHPGATRTIVVSLVGWDETTHIMVEEKQTLTTEDDSSGILSPGDGLYVHADLC